MTIYVLFIVLLAVGLYGMLAKTNLIKKVFGLLIAEHAVNLFLVSVGYRSGGEPPILVRGVESAGFVSGSVDPLPQALVLTSIVIGLGVALLMVAFVLRLDERTRSLSSHDMRRLKG
jgi:multicomponent Na+:H+ antiporter subunit C